MYKGMVHTHTLVVTLFLFIYVIKTILLLGNRTELLQKFSKMIRVPEMIVSFLFLGTGIYLTTQQPFGGKFDYLLWVKLGMVFASIPLAVIGFKKGNKILAALSLLLITGSFGLAEVYSKKKSITATTDTMSTDGAVLYKANCVLCHGDDGKLGIAGAKDLSTSQLSIAEMKEIVLHGKGTMPAAPIDENQAQAVVDYVSASIKGK